MRYQYHVYTAFSRLRNFGPLLDELRPHGVQWHLLVEDTARQCLLSPEPWVRFHFYPPAPSNCAPYDWMANQFLASDLDDSARYLWLCDDDGYPAGFFRELDAVSGDLVIVSMQHRPIGLLRAAPQYMRKGNVAGEQACVTGRIAKQCRFGPDYTGDWTFIHECLKLTAPVFAPHIVVQHNCRYSEYPGRGLPKNA